MIFFYIFVNNLQYFTMKTLYLIRHAKSSWKEPGLSDWQRPLNKRGKRDAPFMGKHLTEKGVKPDIIISSFANRALTTAKIIAGETDYSEDDIEVRKDVYMADETSLLEIVRQIDNRHNTAFLFGHNPDFTFLANQFSKEMISNVPTCGIVQIEFETEQWAAINTQNGRVVSFEYPKKYLV